jgi:uncharacterized protein YjbI with pentapeptide repeats
MRYVSDSPLALGHRVWQLRPPQPSLTVIAKGTFDPAAGDPAPFAEEVVPPTGELWVDDDTERSLRMPSDFALLKPKGECLVVGKAWAEGGRAVSSLPCSFRIGPIEKRFAVFGDRQFSLRLGSVMSEPAPFTSMDLTMDRAYGGPGHAQNPYGRGRAMIDGELPLPNLERLEELVSSRSSKPEPLVIGPLPTTWPARQKLAGTYDAKYMRERWPWLPADFDWRFFQEAPIDQQLAMGFWRGDERIELHNLHPRAASIRSQLPGIWPRVFIDIERTGKERTFEEIPMKLDTIVWDAGIGKLLAVWRGVVEVPSESLDEIASLFVAHDSLSSPLRSAAELEARCRSIVAEEETEEKEAEGAPPPEFEEPTTQVDEPKEETEEEDPEELALEARMREVEAKLASLGVAPADQEPVDPKKILERMRAAGIPTDEIEADLAEAEREEPEQEPAVESPPPEALEGRALVLAKISAGESLRGLDLSHVDLSGLDLSGVVFADAILRGARFAGAQLRAANLGAAVLADADLANVDLTGADLSGADLGGAKACAADFSGAMIEDAIFDGAELTGAQFVCAIGSRASFTAASLSDATFQRAELREADFERAVLDRADFTEALLSDAMFEDASANGARFERAVMTNARCARLRANDARFGAIDADDSYWENAELCRADFSFSKLARALFTEAALIGARMDACALRKARFDGAKAHGLHARKSDLMEASFESADLGFADLRGANLVGAELWRAKLADAELDLALLARTKLEKRA